MSDSDAVSVVPSICSPRFGMCEHVAASHSNTGKLLVVSPFLDV